MPKFPTFPYLFDEEKNISTSKLLQWGYLKMNTRKRGTITWSRNGVETSSIGIEIIMQETEVSELRLIYTCQDVKYNYGILLEPVPSNIGDGKVWYFICPFTGKRCRKLHLINGKFKHRSSLPGGMYSTQTKSKKWRQIEKVYGCYFDSERHYEEIYSKYFKKTYNGKLTKRYKKLLIKIEKAERFSARDIEQLFLL